MLAIGPALWPGAPAGTRGSGASVREGLWDQPDAAYRRAAMVDIPAEAVAGRVTCIITAYNYARFLARAIESIFGQDYPPELVEIIVVDDGSTDCTPELLGAYAGRIQVLRKANGGLVSAVNHGLAAATGELIAFLDGDDTWPAHKLRDQVAYLRAHPAAGLVYGDMEIIDADDRQLHPSFNTWRSIQPLEGRVLPHLVRGNFISGGCMMVRAALRDRFFPIPAESPYADWWIAMRVAEVSDAGYLPGSYNRYRFHGANMGLGAERVRLARANAGELPLRRLVLSSRIAESLSPPDLADALQVLDQQAAGLARTLGRSPWELLPVSADEARASEELRERARAALGRREPEQAFRLLVNAVAVDPSSQHARADLRVFVPEVRPRLGERWSIAPVPARAASSGPPRVSIVIPTYNRLELTRQVLGAIQAHTSTLPYEVIVVDNASSDETPAFLQREHQAGRLRAILNAENAGFGHACNQGARAATGEYVVLLNSDTVPLPGWLDGLVAAADADDSVGIVGSRLLFPDGTIQHAGIDFHLRGIPSHTFKDQPRDHAPALKARDCPAVTAACLLVRRSAFTEIGEFDSRFWMYCEDVDLCLRMWEAGYRVRYQPDSVVIHFEGSSCHDSWERDRRVQQSIGLLQQLWAGRWPLPVQRLGKPRALPDEVRRVVIVAFLDELLRQPALLGAFAEQFGDDDDVTLVVHAPGWSAEDLMARLGPLLARRGLDGVDSADLVGNAVVPNPRADRLLAEYVDGLLTEAEPPPPFAHLPRYGANDLRRLRAGVPRREPDALIAPAASIVLTGASAA